MPVFLFRLILIIGIVYQIRGIYRSGEPNRLLRANNYITSHMTDCTDISTLKPPTARARRIKRIQNPDTLMAKIGSGDMNTIALMAMFDGITGPARLCYSMAYPHKDLSPEDNRCVPLVWLQFKYRWHSYVSYIVDGHLTTVSYVSFMSIIHSDSEINEDIPVETTPDEIAV